jgi:hypothetical protein
MFQPGGIEHLWVLVKVGYHKDALSGMRASFEYQKMFVPGVVQLLAGRVCHYRKLLSQPYKVLDPVEDL